MENLEPGQLFDPWKAKSKPYQKRLKDKPKPKPEPSSEVDLRLRLGLSFRDIEKATNQFEDTVLALHASSPERLNEAIGYWGIPSQAVGAVLKKYHRR